MNQPKLAILQDKQKAGLKALPVPRKYMEDWAKTRSNFLWTAPCFSHILYTMLVPDGTDYVATFTDEIPVAATDAVAIYLHPENFFEHYSLHERVFILGHEVLHAMLNHPGLCFIYRQAGYIKYPDGEQLPYIQKLMGYTLDYVVNALLVADGIGKMPKDAVYDLNVAGPNDHHTEVYRKLFRMMQQQGRLKPCTQGAGGLGGQPQKSGGGKKGQQELQGGAPDPRQKSFDELLEPGEGQGGNPTKAQQERNEAEWKAVIAAGIAASKAQGKGAGALERLITEIMQPSISWQDHIEMFFARKIGNAGYDWRRPDRRWITRSQPIFVPAMSGFGAELIVVAGDSSGSVGEREINLFFGELSGILEDVRPRRLVLMWCDDAVNAVFEVEEPADLVTLRGKGALGGGGTSFVPVFDKIKELNLEPEALIYLTDGMGRFPRQAPKYPTLWGSTYSAKDHYPFGEVVMLPKMK